MDFSTEASCSSPGAYVQVAFPYWNAPTFIKLVSVKECESDMWKNVAQKEVFCFKVELSPLKKMLFTSMKAL